MKKIATEIHEVVLRLVVGIPRPLELIYEKTIEIFE